MSYPYLEEIKKLFVEKKPNVVYGFNYIIKDYKNILELWKKYLITKKIICPFEYEQTLKNIFEFHKTTINHVIIIQSYNLKNCLLMCKMHNNYVNLIIPKIPFHENRISIVATFT
jgi:hypothetical protein